MIPKKVNVCGYTFKIITKKQLGASLDFDKLEMIIGTDYEDKLSIKEIFIHEISEAIHIIMGTRLFRSDNNSYVFLMSHGEFENHNAILFRTLVNNKII